ncbi:MAG: hypothetical protein V1874_08640 [Spirochaetota bacterium]
MMEYIKSLKWIDYFYFCIFEPRRLVNLIGRKEGSPFLMGLVIVFIVSLFEIISFSMLGSETRFFYYKITYGWVFVFLIFILEIIVLSSLMDLFCQFRAHPGSIMLIINLVTFSFFPLFFILPVVIIFTTINFVPVFFYMFFTVLLHSWQAMIIIQGISEIHQISFGESLVTFLLPFIFVGLILFFLLILFFINLVGFISAF